MARLLITGVPGWFGSTFLESIQAHGLLDLTTIRLLVEPSHDSHLELGGRIPIEVVHGTLMDTRTLGGIVKDCDYVVHAAGIIHVRRTRDWYDVNLQGTRNLLSEVQVAGSVRRFVYISSNAAAGRSESPMHLLIESDAPRPLNDYGRSKLMAEQAILSAAGDFERVILRPCMFYGPPVPGRHVEIYRRILYGRMPTLRGTYLRSVTHVQNLVEATRLALTQPQVNGQTYYIADIEPSTLTGVIEAMAAALGVKAKLLYVPGWICKLAYRLDQLAARLGFYFQSLHLLGEANWNVGVSIKKAQVELGYRPALGLREGMREAVDWCRARQLIK